MEIKTLNGIDHKEILDVFNESFSDYFIPFKLSQEQLDAKMLVDKTDLNLSVGAFENGKLIAFILHGFDRINNENIIYNGGTGVIPRKRGAGLTHKMYQVILPILIEKGIHKLLLEVITDNIQAIKSYEKSGFKTNRALLCYKGTVSVSNSNLNFDIQNLQDYNWELMESFWDINPTWQNSKSVSNALQHSNISLGAFLNNQLVGYILYNPISKRIQQIAVSEDYRRKGIASSLFFELIKKYGNSFSIINVDKSSKSMPVFLDKIGFDMNLEQLEMTLELDKN